MKPTAANLLWYLACLPRWRRFRAALRNPAAAQRQVLARLLHDNRDSEFGRRHQFRTIRSPMNLRRACRSPSTTISHRPLKRPAGQGITR
jgi:hypothetical protein